MRTATAPRPFADTLAACGAHPGLLSDADRLALDEVGFVVWRRAIDPAWLAELRAAYDAVLAREGERAGHDYQQEAGAIRIGNLIDKGACFRRVLTHARSLAATWHVMGQRFALSSLSGREPAPGHAPHQRLHADAPAGRDARRAVDAVWMLDDFTRANGATRIIPGSHRWPKRPEEALADPCAPHPEEVVIEAPAGSILLFNGDCWHSGTANRAGTRRRALFPYVLAWRASDGGAYQREKLSAETIAALTTAERMLLGIDG